MALETKAELIARLTAVAQRMNKVREAANALRLIRQGPEPGPPPPLPGGGQPETGFIGQAERPDLAAP